MTVSAETTSPTGAARPDPTAALAGRVSRLRSRVGTGDIDRLLLVVGGLLLPLGVLLVVLGWLGASHTVLLFEQIPYLISGGLLGLALVFTGGFVYFTYWQTLSVRESRTQAAQLQAALTRIEGLLERVATGGGVAAPAAAGTATPAGAAARTPDAAAGGEVLLATPSGTMLHRATCQVVAGREDLRRVAAGTPGFELCRICQP